MRTTILPVLGAAIALAIVAPDAVRAESASPPGGVSEFLDLQGVDCPAINGNTKCFDPNANGQKVFGTLTVVYDKQPNLLKDPPDPTSPFVCPTAPGRAFVRNMYVNLTMDQGGVRVPFSTDFLQGPPAHGNGFCLLTERREQLKVMVELIRAKVIPFFFNCEPNIADSCPPFRIKAITSFQYTTGHPSLVPYPYSGGFSADITIATP
jgi:hypothetical protein